MVSLLACQTKDTGLRGVENYRLQAIEAKDCKWTIEYNALGNINCIRVSGENGDSARYLFIYNSNHQLVKELLYVCNDTIYTHTYTYFGNTIETKKSVDEDGIEYLEHYYYDKKERLIEIRSANPFNGVDSKTVFTYDSNGNVLSEDYYYDSAEDITSLIKYKDYDNKINPLYTLRGLMDKNASIAFHKINSRNNPRRIEIINYYDSDGDGLKDEIRDEISIYAYAYNNYYPNSLTKTVFQHDAIETPNKTTYTLIYE